MVVLAASRGGKGAAAAERVVTLRTGTAERQLPYDQCVLAFGLQPRTDAVPGVSEHALTFHSAEDALELKKQLALTQHACRGTGTPLRIGIIGGGYVGVELAANLASALSAAHANGAPAPRVGRPGSCPPSSPKSESKSSLVKPSVDEGASP